MGYDYFFFYPQEAEEVDYIQSYYDIHSEHEDVLGQPIYSLNWQKFLDCIYLGPLIKISVKCYAFYLHLIVEYLKLHRKSIAQKNFRKSTQDSLQIKIPFF